MTEYWASNPSHMVSTNIHAKSKREAARIFIRQYGFEATYLFEAPEENVPGLPSSNQKPKKQNTRRY